MVDEHGRSERRRHVPDVIEREHKHLPTDRLEPAAPAPAPAEEPLAGFAPVEPAEGYWAGLDSGHRKAFIAAVAGGVVLLALIGVAAWYLVTLQEPLAPARRTPSSSIPSEVPSSSAQTTGSIVTSGSAEASAAATTTPTVPGILRAPLIAYRAGGSIWVSGEHGGNPRSVYPSAGGVFALSPNGTRLAVVDSSVGVLRIVEVATGSSVPVGEAIAILPEWAPDSSYLVYTRPVSGGHAEEVARVEANGAGARKLLDGWDGRVMPDMTTVIAAPVPAPGGSAAIAVMSNGRRLAATTKMNVTEVCPAGSGFYYADAGGLAAKAGGPVSGPTLQWLGYDGRGARVVVAKPASATGASFSGLRLSPDGAWLVYAETGDDGYSRLFSIRTAGGKPIALTPRLDGYFMGWSADGTELFLTEGNAIQGEATRVSAMHPDGTGRRIIVEGGGL